MDFQSEVRKKWNMEVIFNVAADSDLYLGDRLVTMAKKRLKLRLN
jgi:hypothetical protein